AMRGDLRPVTVAPDIGIFLEICRAVLRAVGIVPETDRHRGKRPGADELAFLADHRTAVFVVHLHRHAETFGLDLAAPHRCGRVAEDEARHDVGAAGDG